MRTLMVTVIAFALLGLLVPLIGRAQENAEGAKKVTPEQMMEAMQKYGTPGKEHEVLKQMEGTFDADATFRMDPSSPEQNSKGKTVNELIFDGRFLKSDYSGDFAGSPFKGMNLLGYDRMKKKYINMWTDSMSTALMFSEGTGDAKTITLSGEYDCPITQMKRTMKQVVTIVDKDHHTIEGYDVGADGKEFKTMTLKYTRARAVPVP